MSDILDILQHSLGVDRYGQGEMYREHFVAGPGHSDFETCSLAARDGLMVGRENKHVCGGYIFYVTEAGKQFVRDNSPPPPKTTKAQRRYTAYLNHDCGMGFGEWLTSYGKEIA